MRPGELSQALARRRRAAARLLRAGAGAIGLGLAQAAFAAAPVEFHVAPAGDDGNPGTRAAPFATLPRAQAAVRARPADTPATVWLHAGVHRLREPLRFTALDGGTAAAPVVYAALEDGAAEVSGARELALDWRPEAGGRWSAPVPDGLEFDQVFADGAKMIRARYPNFDPGDGFFGGFAADATAPERLARYESPAGLYVHGYHGIGWGSLHFQLREKSPDGRYTFEAGKDPRVAGGTQNKGRATMAAAPLSPRDRFVENVREELDAPKEWFLDRAAGRLWFIPPAGADPRRMRFEVVILPHLLEVAGTAAAPVRHLEFRGLAFRRAGYTFMQTDRIPSGGDWRIHRGAAVAFEQAEDCAVRDCHFEGIGGNAIIVRDRARGIEVTGCEFRRIGASAVLFDGDASAMRSRWAHSWGWPEAELGPRPLVDGRPVTHPFLALLPEALLATATDGGVIDLTPGPANDRYPARCLVRDCLMVELGTVEKQVAGIFISKARQIVVSQVTIRDVPRAAINLNDGCWGGHVIEGCDIFNTCLESREHGAINTWGRDRYWMRMKGEATPAQFRRMRELARLDAVEPTVIRFNRVQCANGYDLDLDDGSSHYDIHGNLCLQGGIKLREGFFRTVRNNISPLFSPHVWYPDSGDVVTHNILTGARAYDPRAMAMTDARDAWLDFNLFARYRPPPELLAAGLDRHSVTADPGFVAPAQGDFRVRPGSPAEALGFVNFPMDRFGVRSPRLQARTAPWSGLGRALQENDPLAAKAPLYEWRGATLRTLVDFGRESEIVSGMELGHNRGVLIKGIAPGSAASHAHLPADAVIVAVNGVAIARLDDLTTQLRAHAARPVALSVLTARGLTEITLPASNDLPALRP